MNPQATTAFNTLMITLRHFFEHGGSGYPPTHPHGAKRPATIDGATALVASADWVLAQRAARGPHYHSLIDVIASQREELLEALDQVPGKPATAVAAGRRSA